LYAVYEKETTVKQTSTDVVLLGFGITVLCFGIPEIDSQFRKWPIDVFSCLCILCTL